MSGSIAAIAAYDGTGTQGHGTTNKSLPGVRSVFWNENDTDKHYVNGSSFSIISSNVGKMTSPQTVVFTFDNDSDAINDLTLVIERQATDFSGNVGTPLYHMIYHINRIEICIGNQVICTMNTSQLVKEYFDAGDYSVFTDYAVIFSTAEMSNNSAQRINLNIFRMLSVNGMDSSYLMSCANNQTLQVRVYPQNFSLAEFNTFVSFSGAALDILTDPQLTFSLYANRYTMTNAERDFLRNQVIAKRTNITQFAELTSAAQPTGTLNAGSSITINCDHFNLYTSNLYILGLSHAGNNILGGFDVELYLNSMSYNGILPYYIASGDQNIWPQTHFRRSYFYYKIPIAKNAHMTETDQNYVPFSRFDSIRVVLTAKKDIVVADFADFFNTLTVVAEGKCTALYQDGAVVFNNF